MQGRGCGPRVVIHSQMVWCRIGRPPKRFDWLSARLIICLFSRGVSAHEAHRTKGVFGMSGRNGRESEAISLGSMDLQH